MGPDWLKGIGSTFGKPRSALITSLLVASACGTKPAPGTTPEPTHENTDAAVTTPAEVADAARPLDAEPDATPPPAIPERSETGPVPEKIATGSFQSSARKNWPCAAIERWPGGEQRQVRRFVYSKTRTCLIPLELSDQGVTGCPSLEILELRGKFYDLRRFKYWKGRLASVESNMGRTSYDWEGAVPKETGEWGWKRSPGRVEARIIGRAVVDVDADGRALRAWNSEKGVLESSGEFYWTDDRLEHIRWQSYENGRVGPGFSLELVYDCSALPRLKRSVNRRGALGVPVGAD